MDFSSASLTQSAGARLQCRSCGENVIHHKDSLSGIAPPRLDRPADIAPAFRGGKPGLALAPLHPRQRAGFPGLAAGLGKRLGQPSSLVETAGRQSGPMHGRGDDKIGPRHRLARSRPHPARENREPVAASAALQVQNELAGVVVIGERGARRVIGWRASRTSAADAKGARITRQGEAAAAALRIAQELECAPKRRLDHARAIDDLLGQERARRPDQVRQPRDRATFPESGAWAIGCAQ